MRCPFCGETHPAGTYVCPKTQRRLTGLLEEGTTVDGKYRVQGIIGVGGMAVVYRAEHTKIGRVVALKMLLPEYVVYPELTARVEREARAAGGIDHANVVAIVDLGTTPEYGPYIAMELLKGEELATHLERRGGTIAAGEAAEITRQVLGALDAAHAKGVVHRDLKPENIFLARVDDDERRVVKVLDFGISKLGEEKKGVSSLTRTGTVMGTPQFMAPEQAAGAREQDARVDIYACGAVLYAMLTGQLPYNAENYNLLINEILNKPPRPITDYAPDLEPQLAAIVMRAITRNPSDRFPNARAMQDAIVDWLEAQFPERADTSTGRIRIGTSPGQPPGRRDSSAGGRTSQPNVAPRQPTPPPIPVASAKGAIASPNTTQPIELKRVPRAPSGVSSVSGPDEPTVMARSPRPSSDDELAHATTALIEEIPELPPIESLPHRADTRTPLGWENTPGGVVLPRPKRRGWIYSLVAVAVISGGLFALRTFDPSAWNVAVGTVGLEKYAVATGPAGTEPHEGATHSATHTHNGNGNGASSNDNHANTNGAAGTNGATGPGETEAPTGPTTNTAATPGGTGTEPTATGNAHPGTLHGTVRRNGGHPVRHPPRGAHHVIRRTH